MRNTKQKQIIRDVLGRAGRPLTTQEVLARGRKRLPALGIATVYREVGRLCTAGELKVVELPGDPPRYEIQGHHHHHFKCTECEKVFELEGCLKDVARLVPKGFRHESHDITIFGRCRSCS